MCLGLATEYCTALHVLRTIDIDMVVHALQRQQSLIDDCGFNFAARVPLVVLGTVLYVRTRRRAYQADQVLIAAQP